MRPRVLMTADSVGGVFEHAIDLATGLQPLGFDTVLAVLGPRMDAQQRAAAAAAASVVVETDLKLDWLAENDAELRHASLELAEMARSHDATVVHLNNSGVAAAAFDAPVVVASHSCLATWWRAVRGGAMPPDFRWRVDAVTRTMEEADIVVCPTLSFALESAQVHACAARTVYNGRVPASMTADGPHAVVAFTAGRLWDDGKDFRTLDDAAGMSRIPLLAAGSLVSPSGAHAECRHAEPLGPLSQAQMRAMLARRPVFVSAAVYETFGLAVLEAAQAGCALVLADIPTYRELWEDAAVFVPARDARGFADAIDRVAEDPELRATLAAAAQGRARRYTVENMAAGIAGLYAELGVVAL